MTKPLRPIVITLVIVLLIIVVMIMLVFVFPQSEEVEEEPEATVSTSETVKIISEDDSELISFEMLPSGGESMLVEISRDSDGTLSYEVTPATKYFDYDTSKFRSMIYTLTSLSATNFVEEGAQDLGIYGLDKPQFTMRCTYKGGRVLDLYIGNLTPTDSNYYVKTSDSDDVYTLGSYVVGNITRSDIDYRQITLFPTYTDDEIYENINYVKLTNRDGTEIEIILEDTESYSEKNVVSSAYYMLSPAEGSCNDTLVQEKILDVVATLSNSGVYRDITEDEYAEYGFDNPAKLEMTDISGNSVSILIGNKLESGVYYVMLEQSPETVILCPTTAFEWIGINYIELMNRIMWYENITNIESIEYDMDGTAYLVAMIHGTEEKEDGTTKNTITATINGEALSETNCRRLFTRTLNFRIIGDVPAGEKLTKASYTITLNLLDGSSRTLSFYQLNERQFACELEGEVKYYVYKKNITTLLDAFQTIADGKELTMSYDN